MTRIISILLCFFLFSCGTKKAVVGSYSRKYETLSLLKDSTFYYWYRYEQPSAIAFGSWYSVGKNKILLKSKYSPIDLPIRVWERTTKEKGIRVIFTPEDSIQYSYIKDKVRMSYVIDSNHVIEDVKDNMVMEREHIASLKIVFNFPPNERKYFPYLNHDKVKTITYHVIDKNTNTLTVSVPIDFDIFFATEVDDIIELQNNNIYWMKKGLPFFKRIKGNRKVVVK